MGAVRRIRRMTITGVLLLAGIAAVVSFRTDPQIPRHLRDGLAGLLHDTHRARPELRIKTTSRDSCHDQTSPGSVSTLRGVRHEVLFDRAEMKGLRHLPVVAGG